MEDVSLSQLIYELFMDSSTEFCISQGNFHPFEFPWISSQAWYCTPLDYAEVHFVESVTFALVTCMGLTFGSPYCHGILMFFMTDVYDTWYRSYVLGSFDS